MKKIELLVKTKNNKYPVIIGSNLFVNFLKLLKRHNLNFNKYLLVIDTKIPKKSLSKVIKSLPKNKVVTHFFNSSELNKNLKSTNKIVELLLKNNFHRNDCVISIGGGITGDVTGFASSIFKRGIKFINIPTTLLAQVDSSIGGKTGVNSEYGKNLIGSFYQPSLVVSDINFLKTLPKREIICGYGEILKHSIIADKKFFLFLNKNFKNIIDLKTPFIEKSIYKSCIIKKKIVEKDEKESNSRKILNLGHTFGHAYEGAYKYSNKLNHGEAVIFGILSASKFSLKNKILPKKEFDLINNHLIKFNLPRNLKKIFSIKDLKNIIAFMEKDKKNNDKKINLVLIKKIGNPIYNKKFETKKIHSFIKNELTN